MTLTKEDIKSLAKLAMVVRGRAYAPYSNHPVGAVIVAKSGMVYVGANVETAHYKSVCAEASAISSMIAGGDREIDAVIVVGPNQEHPSTPCGDCRQRINEFADKTTRIYTCRADGKLGKTHTIASLLPDRFGPEHVPGMKKKTVKKTGKRK